MGGETDAPGACLRGEFWIGFQYPGDKRAWSSWEITATLSEKEMEVRGGRRAHFVARMTKMDPSFVATLYSDGTEQTCAVKFAVTVTNSHVSQAVDQPDTELNHDLFDPRLRNYTDPEFHHMVHIASQLQRKQTVSTRCPAYHEHLMLRLEDLVPEDFRRLRAADQLGKAACAPNYDELLDISKGVCGLVTFLRMDEVPPRAPERPDKELKERRLPPLPSPPQLETLKKAERRLLKSKFRDTLCRLRRLNLIHRNPSPEHLVWLSKQKTGPDGSPQNMLFDFWILGLRHMDEFQPGRDPDPLLFNRQQWNDHLRASGLLAPVAPKQNQNSDDDIFAEWVEPGDYYPNMDWVEGEED
ncbi:uncharacterized protein BP01DRAFT_363212 [Aspergillus saccharolyticus JOP 1030-1]|uniref:Uncharacterized protein n=1 Tax=Aspergillus saccharolyticus JOP 1030-1 TaxID=1450539 RepID=A0A318ZM60_9EURO|nr:hypothetical protein BP01DRAFT_363212 [Aspergillus saccharolyticus JOP 1030-1]PYH48027.1 hypothetical protein BP01DRAFT_363212 [Aspergillus saccharolyticus JOP 1030-1]